MDILHKYAQIYRYRFDVDGFWRYVFVNAHLWKRMCKSRALSEFAVKILEIPGLAAINVFSHLNQKDACDQPSRSTNLPLCHGFNWDLPSMYSFAPPRAHKSLDLDSSRLQPWRYYTRCAHLRLPIDQTIAIL